MISPGENPSHDPLVDPDCDYYRATPTAVKQYMHLASGVPQISPELEERLELGTRLKSEPENNPSDTAPKGPRGNKQCCG
jgi:hypothetical protein